MLARLHSVDFAAVGLGDFGRPDGFLERNLRRWGKQWQSNKTRELPVIDELARRLAARCPNTRTRPSSTATTASTTRWWRSTIPGRIIAVLDWEMSTLGDPMTDLGLLAVYWGERQGEAVLASQGVSDVPGFLSSDEVMERYAKQSGRDLSDARLLRRVRGVQARDHRRGHQRRGSCMGKTLGTGFEDMGPTVDALADAALDVADRSSIRALRG